MARSARTVDSFGARGSGGERIINENSKRGRREESIYAAPTELEKLHAANVSEGLAPRSGGEKVARRETSGKRV
jgi:hypothetical protein